MRNILSKIRVDYSTYILILLGLFAGYIKNIFIILVIVIVHELGHVFFFYLYKIDIDSVVIYPFGGVSKVNKKIHERIYKDIFISIGGIMFQTILIILIYILYNNDFIVFSTYRMFINYNITVIYFNLIPLVPLDGSKLLFSICSLFLSYKRSYYLMVIVSMIFLMFFIIYNMMFKLNDIVIYLFLIISLIKCIKDYKYVRNRFYLERILYDNYYNGIISDTIDVDRMRLDKYYYFFVGNKYVNEREYLLKNR